MRHAKFLLATFATVALVVSSTSLPHLSANAATYTAARAADLSNGVDDGTALTLTKVGVVDLGVVARQAAARPVRSPGPDRALGALFAHGRSGVISAAAAAQAPRPQSATLTGATASIVHNFLGLTAVDNQRVNAYNVEPPDEAMCAGPTYVMNQVNLAAALYDKTGRLVLGPVSVNAFYNEGTTGFTNLSYLSDPRCYYDPQAQAWFAEIWEYNGSNESHIDLAVNPNVNPTGPWTIYRFDTSHSVSSAATLPDYTTLGTDANGVYLTSDNYTITPFGNYVGASMIAISKADLLAGAANPYALKYANLMNGGQQANTLQPSTSPFGSGYTAGTEYFVDALGELNGSSIDNRLGVWALSNTGALNSHGHPRLSKTVIRSEIYGQPPNALQKGSSATLNTDDSRIMQPVQNVNGTLYAANNTVVLPSGTDTMDRSGAAWYKIVPALSASTPATITGATIPAQGYVALSGNYLMYPAIAVNTAGAAAMILSLSGPDYYPSVAYAVGPTFSTLKIATPGTGPDTGFTCVAPYGPPCRWGDYSAAALDTTSNALWFATQYIGPPGDRSSNWANRILNIAP